jgi:light-regulated signal transduction histidine kinase (bacteriophytochrome)
MRKRSYQWVSCCNLVSGAALLLRHRPGHRRPVFVPDVAVLRQWQACPDWVADIHGRRTDANFVVGTLRSAAADPALLKQALVNLLSNAIKFTRDKHPASIEVGCRGAAEAGDATIYYVKDNGVGFDMRYADKLFGVFQRLHSADEYEGTGVGLAIVQRMVDRHGGRVWPDSQPGAGATFYFTLQSGQPR